MRYPPELDSLLSAAIEKVINDAIVHDPGTYAQLAQLDGSIASIIVTDWQIRLVLGVVAQNVTLVIQRNVDETIPSDVSLRGNLKDLLRLFGKDASSLANTGVEVQGKLALLTTLQTMGKNLNIDWQSGITKKMHELLGDNVAPVTNSVLSAVFSAAGRLHDDTKASLKNGTAQFAHYVEHEMQMLPNRQEQVQRTTAINTLRTDADRLEAKWRKLQARMSP